MTRPTDRRRFRFSGPRLGLLLLVAVAIGCGYAARLGVRWFHLKRFAVVEEGVLYRSAQPTEDGIKQLVLRHGVRTVVNMRREDPPLHTGLWDHDEPDGETESTFVAGLGAKPVQWNMGGEAYWPWLGPEQFEAFFELFDDPANLPVSVHCMGGRHRTGTFVALFRIEYHGWPVPRALEEMYAFNFGHPIPIQEHHLRTYSRRPRPDVRQWLALQKTFGELLDDPQDYAQFVRRLKASNEMHEGDANVRQTLEGYVRQRQPFSLCLAHRLVASSDDELAELACARAAECLQRTNAAAADWTAAAADWTAAASLIADFGTPAQQQALLAILENESRTGDPSARYQAVVRGVTNRYTPNRLAFLRPLLDDPRPRPEPHAVYTAKDEQRRYRYCDSASAALCVILDRHGVLAPFLWEESRQRFVAWFEKNPQATQLARLGESRVDVARRK